MRLYIVRHAKAGSRHQWDGPDQIRPLSKKGQRQAEGLVRVLVDRHVERMLSSPFLRCVETIQPLADKLGTEVEQADALGEGARTKDAMALVRSLDRVDSLLCSHGDVISKILDALAIEDNLPLRPDYPCAKGSTWELAGENGHYMDARYVPPPD